ncbi:hypothetical protein D3C86_1626830 [compost metagenome]
MILVSKPLSEAVCIRSIAFPSAKPSLMSTKTTSAAKSFIAMYSAQLAPTAPAPTTVTFIIYLFIVFIVLPVNIIKLPKAEKKIILTFIIF